MSFFIRKKGGAMGKGLLADKRKQQGKRKGGNRRNPVEGIEQKRRKMDEEIESDDEDSDLGIDDEGVVLNEEDYETAQDKKVRLAKLYLDEIEKEERKRAEDADVDEDVVSKRLHEDVLEAEGRLRKEVAAKISVDTSELRELRNPLHLKSTVTCAVISPSEDYIFSGCKDGDIFKWSLSNGQKVGMVKHLERLTKRKAKKGVVVDTSGNSTHSSTITSIAISSDGKFLATGDLDSKIVIWNPDTLQKIHVFSGHKKAIRGLVFRKKTHTLYSASDDRTVRIWSLDEMGYVETLFGHQDAVTAIDALSRERALSAGGRDGSIRVWKIVEESQLVYNTSNNGAVDCVKLVNEENFVSAAEDGSISTWNVNRKKPLFTQASAHGVNEETGQPNWIASLCAMNNTDLIASGSSDGYIRLWKVGEKFKSLQEVSKIPCVGWVNSLQFSNSGKYIVAGVGKEHRLGRWFTTKEARNSVVVFPVSKAD